MSAELVGLVIVAVSGTIGLLKIGLERWVARLVDSGFDRRLEKYRHALLLETEKAKHDFRRDLANFSLYSERRHAASSGVYAKVREAHGAVAGLFGVRREPTFEEYNRISTSISLKDRYRQVSVSRYSKSFELTERRR